MKSTWYWVWYHLRGGVAYTLLEWSIQAFHRDDPDKVIIAKAILQAQPFLGKDNK